MVGRRSESETLWRARDAEESQFIAIYGRRRVGKTYLVRKAFDGEFAFYHTGIANVGKQEQISRFVKSLEKYGIKTRPKPKDWFAAFDLLADGLAAMPSGRKVVFIDELPWMDTARSNFVSALENFWNGWASAREDIVLIVCGSASSWILSKIINNHGGLHNWLTDRIHLKPFSLHECRELAEERGLILPLRQLFEANMIFGGVPYYWTLLRRDTGLAQNIDRLCFSDGGALTTEFDQLYASLFRKPADHIAVVTALGKKKVGMTREELIRECGMTDSGALTKVLDELSVCGFIRKYRVPGCKKKGAVYQLVDNFTLFYFRFMQDAEGVPSDFWSTSYMKQSVRIWCGLSFERVCLENLSAIKKALGISGVRTSVYAWSSAASGKTGAEGAQIDLVIDRDDGVVNLCEIKYLSDDYEIDESEASALERRRTLFMRETGTNKAVHLTIISFSKVKKSVYAGVVQSIVTAEELLLA